MGRTTRRVHDRHRPTRRTSAHRRRIAAILAESLEDRSVPSGLGVPAISALTSALQSTASLAQDVLPPIDLGGTAVAPASSPTATVVPLIDVALGSPATDPGAADASTGPSIDGPGVVSIGAGQPAVAASGDVLHTLDGALAGVAAGLTVEGAGVGVSSSGGSAPGSMGIAISNANPGAAHTLPGPSVTAGLPLASPAPIGGTPDLGPPSLSTTPPAPVGPTATSPPAPGGQGAVSLPGAGPAASTGSTSGGPAPAVGNPAAAFAPGAGSIASPGTPAGAAAHQTAPPTTISDPAGPAGNESVAGQGTLEDASSLANASSVAAERAASPELTPAELVPADLESLERALGQLLRRFDGMGEDLAGWFTSVSLLETLATAGLLVLAVEVFRRWERQRQLAIPRVRVGPGGRPGPFYRPRDFPAGLPGPRFGRPATV